MHSVTFKRWQLERFVVTFQDDAHAAHLASFEALTKWGDCEEGLALARQSQRDAEMFARHGRKHLDRLLGVSE